MAETKNNDDLIDKLKTLGYIKNEGIELIFRAVDRGFYFLPGYKRRAYVNLPWRNCNFHISAPVIYAAVMEKLNLKPGLSFLNIGSGTGYLSTMVGLVLGSYGINHGVEIYSDLIEYAYKKLREFRSVSPAMDAFDFCEPIFVKGNCLCLHENSRLYDRVYCGAACPRKYLGFMQNLLNVGGILVMPMNYWLLQITRTSENTWVSVPILSVTYATLLEPEHQQTKKFVVLPEVNPLSLQELCRSVIRSAFREQAKDEYPGISLHNKKTNKRKRSPGRLIIRRMNCGNDSSDVSHNMVASVNSSTTELQEHSEDALNETTRESIISKSEDETSEDEEQRKKSPKIEQTEELHGEKNNTGRSRNTVNRMPIILDKNVAPNIDEPSQDILQRAKKEKYMTFSKIMQIKILSLPIPRIIKNYLNYDRPFTISEKKLRIM